MAWVFLGHQRKAVCFRFPRGGGDRLRRSKTDVVFSRPRGPHASLDCSASSTRLDLPSSLSLVQHCIAIMNCLLRDVQLQTNDSVRGFFVA